MRSGESKVQRAREKHPTQESVLKSWICFNHRYRNFENDPLEQVTLNACLESALGLENNGKHELRHARFRFPRVAFNRLSWLHKYTSCKNRSLSHRWNTLSPRVINVQKPFKINATSARVMTVLFSYCIAIWDAELKLSVLRPCSRRWPWSSDSKVNILGPWRRLVRGEYTPAFKW